MTGLTKFLSGAAAALAIVCAMPAHAEYPERPVQFVVPWPPGDLEDVLTRLIAEHMTEVTGKPATVVNKPGGGGVIGATDVAQARADGYTIGSFVVDIPTVHVMLGNAQFTQDTFEPVGIFLYYPFVIAAKKDAPYNNLAELAAYAKGNKVSLGHFGYELIPTMVTFKAAKELGFSFGSDAAFDALDCSTLSNGDADVINTTTQQILPCLQSGDVKIIAALTKDRMSLAPDVATIGEQVKGLDTLLWNGLFVPKGTPDDVKAKIAQIAREAIMGDKAQEIAKTTGAGVFWMDSAESAATVKRDFDGAKALLDVIKK